MSAKQNNLFDADVIEEHLQALEVERALCADQVCKECSHTRRQHDILGTCTVTTNIHKNWCTCLRFRTE